MTAKRESVSLRGVENIVELDSGNDCTTLEIYQKKKKSTEVYTLKAKRVNSMVCES